MSPPWQSVNPKGLAAGISLLSFAILSTLQAAAVFSCIVRVHGWRSFGMTSCSSLKPRAQPALATVSESNCSQTPNHGSYISKVPFSSKFPMRGTPKKMCGGVATNSMYPAATKNAVEAVRLQYAGFGGGSVGRLIIVPRLVKRWDEEVWWDLRRT